MKKLRKITITLVFLFSTGAAFGDSYAPSTPEAYTSPNGSYVVRIDAAENLKNPRYFWKTTTFRVFKYNKITFDYSIVSQFDVKGHPLEVMINDAGTNIVTIDQQFGVGYGQIAAIYTLKGKQLKEWYLKDLYNVKNLFTHKGIPKFRRSTSSIYWRGDARWSSDQRSVRVGSPATFKYNKEDGSFTIRHGKEFDSYLIDLNNVEMTRVSGEK